MAGKCFGGTNMIFFYILFALFFYFLFMWAFRLFFLVLLGKMVNQAKSRAEDSIKEKVESFKRGVKDGGENM